MLISVRLDPAAKVSNNFLSSVNTALCTPPAASMQLRVARQSLGDWSQDYGKCPFSGADKPPQVCQGAVRVDEASIAVPR